MWQFRVQEFRHKQEKLASTVSIQSLVDYYELSEGSLDLQVSDRHLDEIACTSCRQWKSLATRLGVPSIVVDDIDARQVSEEEKRRNFFFKWKSIEGSNATYRRLIEGLVEIRSQEDAESVCKLMNVVTQQPTIAITMPLLPSEHNRTSENNTNAETSMSIVILHAMGIIKM